VLVGIPNLLVLEGEEFDSQAIQHQPPYITSDLLDLASIVIKESKYSILFPTTHRNRKPPFPIGTKVYVNAESFFEDASDNWKSRIKKYEEGLLGRCDDDLSVEEYEKSYLSLQVI
jgi:hypothetical protein